MGNMIKSVGFFWIVTLILLSNVCAESVFIVLDPASTASNISADGSSVVGRTKDGEAFLWSQQGGFVNLQEGFVGPGASVSSAASAASADGLVVVGQVTAINFNAPFRWTAENGMETLGELSGGFLSSGRAHDVSSDGSVIVGTKFGTSDGAFRWTEGGDTVLLGARYAYGVSNDGNVVIGYKYNGVVGEGFRWTEEQGIVGVGDLPGGDFFSNAGGVSGDGNVVVGQSLGEAYVDFRWTEGDGIIGLGHLRPDYYGFSTAHDASFDGSIIVGTSPAELPNGSSYPEAFVWDEMHGIRGFQGLLEQYFGLDLFGMQLWEIGGVSDDGLSFVGRGRNKDGIIGWYAKIDVSLIDVDYIPYLQPFPINIPHVSPYIVKKIVDTDTDIPEGTGKFTGEFGGVAISKGMVLFKGRGSDNQQGLYLDDSKTGAIDVIVDKGSTLPGFSFSSFDRFAIDQENVAYHANLIDDVTSSRVQSIVVYTPTGGNSIIIDNNTPIPDGVGNFTRFGGPGYAGIDIEGNHLVFKGGGTDGQQGIYISDLNGSNIKLVADRNTLIPNSLNKFDFFMYSNIDDGGVSFLGRDESDTVGIYYFDLSTETIRMIVDSNTKAPDFDENFDDLNSPSSSGKKIAFSARQGVYVANTETGALLKIADKNTPIPDGIGTFTWFGRLAMDGEKVAFVGGSFYGNGIYVGDGNSLSAIITDLDKLDDKNIHSLFIWSYTARDNFDDNQLVFEVYFMDGSNGIYLAGPIFVNIDIKPGSYPNCFNNNGHGVIPVAILGSADFDCTQVDPATISLEGLSIKMAGKSNKYLAHYEDVNVDGFDDLVVKIEDSDAVFQEGQTTATLTGNLYEEYGGTEIEGTDNICIVP